MATLWLGRSESGATHLAACSWPDGSQHLFVADPEGSGSALGASTTGMAVEMGSSSDVPA